MTRRSPSPSHRLGRRHRPTPDVVPAVVDTTRDPDVEDDDPGDPEMSEAERAALASEVEWVRVWWVCD